MLKEKYISEAQMKEEPKKKLVLKIKEGSITPEHFNKREVDEYLISVVGSVEDTGMLPEDKAKLDGMANIKQVSGSELDNMINDSDEGFYVADVVGGPLFVEVYKDGYVVYQWAVEPHSGKTLVRSYRLQDVNPAWSEFTDAYADKQDSLIFDDVPAANSDNPVKSQGIKTALDTLDGRIDAIIGGNATLSLSVSPASIFANTSASVTATATASMQATNIDIKKGGTTVQSGSNTTSINYTETVTLNSGEAITYSAESVINGVTKTVSNKTVRAYDKIYYGVGTENSYSGITTYQSIRTNANGTYAFNITSEKQYAYILEPYAMTAINLSNVKLDSGFGYNLQLISDNATIDGVRYRVYRSAANAAGENFNVVIS